MRRLLTLSAWLAGLVPAAAMATPTPLCGRIGAEASADDRMLGHIRYTEAAAFDLVTVASASLPDKPCRLHRGAARDMTRLVGAARAAGIGNIRGISCFRSVERQREIFCGPVKAGQTPARRARSVGPPGFSEHATGYALDFGLRPKAPNCPDVEACIAYTRAGRWLLDNAPEYGFELSFPAGNAQSVTWEPWHWRWVGTSVADPAAMIARILFARARREFAASPVVDDVGLLPMMTPIAPSPRIEAGPPVDVIDVTPERMKIRKR